MIEVGLMGSGQAGRAVAHVCSSGPRFELPGIARRTASNSAATLADSTMPESGLDNVRVSNWPDAHPADALVDLSTSDTLAMYGEAVRRRQLMLVNAAISAHGDNEPDVLCSLGADVRIIPDSIERKAFGIGAAFARHELAVCANGITPLTIY